METELEMAERHVSEGTERVARQGEILAELKRDGHPTHAAEELLAVFKTTLAAIKEDLVRIRREVETAAHAAFPGIRIV